MRWTSFLVGAASLLMLLILWEYFGSIDGSALSAVIPPPSRVFTVLVQSGFRVGLGSQAASLPTSIASTFFRVFCGMALAFVAAIGTGAVMSLIPFVRWMTAPVLYLLAPIAPIAWIPTALVIFGVSNLTAIFIVFMGVYFILTLATLAEISRVPEEFMIIARNLGGRGVGCWFRVMLPAITPGVFMLLRTNFIAAWMAVLVAEMVGLNDGLGAIIMMGRNLFNSDLIMLGMITIGLSGFIVDRILLLIGTRLIWWRN